LFVSPSVCQEEAGGGSPKSTLYGLPKSGQESPNGGASQGNSPPSSPLEQRPTDPWDILYEASGEVARMRAANSVPYGYAPPARNSSPPPPPPHAPAGTAAGGVYYHPFAHFVTQRQIMAARVSFGSSPSSAPPRDFMVLGIYVR
jgi:hypothetical protein